MSRFDEGRETVHAVRALRVVVVGWVVVACGLPVVGVFLPAETANRLYDVMRWPGTLASMVLLAVALRWRNSFRRSTSAASLLAYGSLFTGLLAGFYSAWAGVAVAAAVLVLSLVWRRLAGTSPGPEPGW